MSDAMPAGGDAAPPVSDNKKDSVIKTAIAEEKTDKKNLLRKITQAEAGGLLNIRNEDYFFSFLAPHEVWTHVKRPGEFLVRQTRLEENKLPDHYVICCMSESGPAEFPILFARSRKICYVHNLCFDTPSGLIEYHRRMRYPIDEDESFFLTTPVSKGAWLVNHAQIHKNKKLPEGSTGQVWVATLRTGVFGRQTVATKIFTPVDSQAKMEPIFKLAMLMKSLVHPNIVKFIGVAVSEYPPHILTEYAVQGSMSTIVEKTPGPTVGQRESFAYDIAKGLQYLQERLIIHRDLNARNILIDSRNRAKIGDFQNAIFGVIIRERLGRAPFRYLSPEVFKLHTYSTKSDIWSYGVVCWEIFHNGRLPYDHVDNHKDVRDYVLSGNKLTCTSQKFPTYLWKIAEACWTYHPDKRPMIEDIIGRLKENVKEGKGFFETFWGWVMPF